MARVLIAKCECCGRLKDDPTAEERQRGVTRSWWMVEDHGEPLKTMPLDFCSLRCLALWLLEMKRQADANDVQPGTLDPDAGKPDWHKREFSPQDEPMIAARVQRLVEQMMQPWPEATATLTDGKGDSEHN